MSRVQLALNVADLEASITFYSTLFGVAPHKRRDGYANFEVTEPALKLVLIEVPTQQRGTGVVGALNHLGVEVSDVDQVSTQATRLKEAGLATFDEQDTSCCYALQDKVWVSDPAGTPWEIYTVKDDDPADPQPATATLSLPDLAAGASGCCAPEPVAAKPSIRVFEPALCCNTGVCGPDTDEALVVFTADMHALQDLGVDIARHNLANDPQAFASSETVRTFLQLTGSQGLPLTQVDGVTVLTGQYPDRETLMRLAGVAAPVLPAGVSTLQLSDESSTCCSGTSCC